MGILGKFIGKSGAQINKLRADIQAAVGWVSLKVHTPDMLILRSHLPPGGQHFVELLADNPEKRDIAKGMIVLAIEETKTAYMEEQLQRQQKGEQQFMKGFGCKA